MKNFEFKKSLGQNFLIDQNIINKIVSNINVKENSLIIEIGPGSGALTKKLINLKADVICFEIDKRLEQELSSIKAENLKIIYEDFLKTEIKEYITKKYDYIFYIGNLPYYITTPIIKKIHEQNNADEIVFMVQKEVADRFLANPNTKEYSSLSVFLQYNYNIERLFNVSKTCFKPIPKVESTVIKLNKSSKKTYVKDESKFYQLVKDSFKYKRKNIKNNLKEYDLKKIEIVLNSFGKDLTCRAESLTIDEFIKISNKL